MPKNGKKVYSIKRNYSAVGAFLKEKRLKANLTQREVSERLGYSSAQFVSNFEAGIVVPPMSKLGLLIKLFKIEPKEIMDVILEAEREIMMSKIHSSSKRSQKKS